MKMPAQRIVFLLKSIDLCDRVIQMALDLNAAGIAVGLYCLCDQPCRLERKEKRRLHQLWQTAGNRRQPEMAKTLSTGSIRLLESLSAGSFSPDDLVIPI